MSVAENIYRIRQRIAAAAERVGRKPQDVKLVAVTKTVDIPVMEAALAAKITAFGENRVQELVRKYAQLGDTAEWHLIGHLQTNKVKQVIDKVVLIHSLDRLNLAQELSKVAQNRGLKVPVLLEVNVSGEASKYGLAPQEVVDFLQEILAYPGLMVQGLMTVAPLVSDPEETRPVFRGLAVLARNIQEKNLPNVSMQWLSMGMTNDFEIAVEEGANLVRVGSGIFGPRDYTKGV